MCTFEEHKIAAEVINCDCKGQCVMEQVHAALRKWWAGDRGCGQQTKDNSFNPLKEYVNVASHGMGKEIVLSQDKLMTAGDDMDVTSKSYVKMCT